MALPPSSFYTVAFVVIRSYSDILAEKITQTIFSVDEKDMTLINKVDAEEDAIAFFKSYNY